jgi:heme/copper-type cytochrome/quinol oxidase subunit 2
MQELLQVDSFNNLTKGSNSRTAPVNVFNTGSDNTGLIQGKTPSNANLGSCLKESGLFLTENFSNNSLKTFILDHTTSKSNGLKFSLGGLDNTSFKGYYKYTTYSIHEESTRDVKNYMGKPNPLTLVKIPVNKLDALSDDTPFLFKFRYNDANSKLSSKNNLKVPYFAFKQQRYKSRKVIPMVSKQYVDDLGVDKIAKNNFTLSNQYSITTDVDNPTRYYRMFRKNRIRSENMPVVVSKRLLRVKRTLVLPTHINITAVTNSYDVVHSWFIPGLGLKMDCVPGRSTHHTFYIDNAGFYYGQCAEICGRYHHHMPIRVCALPFEHFLVW